MNTNILKSLPKFLETLGLDEEPIRIGPRSRKRSLEVKKPGMKTLDFGIRLKQRLIFGYLYS